MRFDQVASEPLTPFAPHCRLPSSTPCERIMRMAAELEGCDDEPDSTLEGDHYNLEQDPNFIEDRFRVDRRKLEQMLQAAVEGMGQTGEEFFQKIMEETDTTITWPSKLKIGAKSKKDPHIKVIGLPEDVRVAKEKVMAVLDTKSNRVTLKMDVSHTDHSHIIGKGGYNIKKVMQDTGCHIHFPDSNRGSTSEKSNQVSIAGQPLGVECARKNIREMLPLVLTFDLPLTGRLPSDNNTIIQRISQTYNVAISFKQRPRSGTQTVIVRGCQQQVSAIKEAIMRLVEHFTGNIASSVPVSMQIDIAPQHHLFIIGRNGANIKQINQVTGASVNFPDPNGTQRKGVVFLTGTVESVVRARSQLLGCLPLVLMFDLREEDGDIDAMKLNKVMDKYDVFVSVKPKPKQPSKSVIIKSAERNADNVYLARMEILGVDSNENRAASPSILSSPSHSPVGGMDRPFYPSMVDGGSPLPTTPYSAVVNGKTSPPIPTTSWFPSTVSNSIQSTGTSIMNGPYGYLSPSPPPLPPPGLGPATSIGVPSYSNFIETSSNGSYGTSTSTTGNVQSPIGHRACSPMGHRTPSPLRIARSPVMDTRESPCLQGSSGSSSPKSPTAGSPPPLQEEAFHLSRQRSGSDLDIMQGASSSGTDERQTVEILSGAKNVCLHTSDTGDSESLSSSLRSALFNKLLLNHPPVSIPPIDEYERKKELASKAMQKKVHFPEVRVPTNSWSGLGFSKSMPGSAIKEMLETKERSKGNMLPYSGPDNRALPEHPMPSSSMMPTHDSMVGRESRSNSTSVYETSTHLDSEATFNPTVGDWSRHSSHSSQPTTDLESLFDRLGLSKYFSNFQEQEVDLQTFMTLTDEDLNVLGVCTFGARRKLLMAIQDLKKKQMGGPRQSIPPNPSPQPSYSDSTRTSRTASFSRVASLSGRW